MSHVVVKWLRKYEVNSRCEKEIVEKCVKEWLLVNCASCRGYMKLTNDGYYVCIESYRGVEELVQELMNVLDKSFTNFNLFILTWSEVINQFTNPSLYFTCDGFVETPFTFDLSWFHGQELVNDLISSLGLEIVRDYDGMTRIVVKVGRPYTVEKVDKAFYLISKGLQLYNIIKKVQEAEAIKVTLNFIQLLKK